MEIQLGEHDCACSMLLARAGLGVCQYGGTIRSGDGASHTRHTSDVPAPPPVDPITIFDSGREKFETFLTFVLYRLCSAPDRYALTMPNEARPMRHVARADPVATFLPLTMPGDINAIRGPISDHHQLQYHLSC